ncbi:MAG: flagellar basal body rod protein FlgC [Waddliaceae bacterium]|nr:flagellar basal body rod protein FlgC [Waddliaceae bacterium]
MISKLNRAGQIAATGLKANRGWMNVISNNIANAHSVDNGKRTANGNFVPYARQVPVFERILSENFRRNKVNGDVADGVAVKEVSELNDHIRKVFDPTHPAARKAGSPDAGYVYYPKISVAQEMADMQIASAAYEANLSIISVSQRMSENAMRISRRG